MKQPTLAAMEDTKRPQVATATTPETAVLMTTMLTKAMLLRQRATGTTRAQANIFESGTTKEELLVS
jgi:hypothetical protein